MRPLFLRGALAAALVWGLGWGATGPAAAQGGFETLDPSYGGETARRGFYGGLALSGEAAFRNADQGAISMPGAPTGSDLALSARLDYALLPQVDLALVADLSGAARRGAMGLSWVVVKPYWHSEATDYAVRLAVDPASEGGLGFRQTDVAFLSTTALSPTTTYDFAVGLRRVRAGYTTLQTAADPLLEPSDVAAVAALEAEPGPEAVRLVGQEVRISWDGNVLFDPAGSRLSVGIAAEGNRYTVISVPAAGLSSDRAPAEGAGSGEPGERVWGGTGWVRAGLEFSRPEYRLAPFASLPVFAWVSDRGEPVRHGPRLDKVQFGLRVTLR
jgi:hypothetical protein